MRNLMIFAAVMVGLGTMMAQMADKMTAAPPALANRPRERPRSPKPSARRDPAASASLVTSAAIS